MNASLGIEVKLDHREPRRVTEVFERFAAANGVKDRVAQRVSLALDEILTNVVQYGFDDGAEDPGIRVDLDLGDGFLRIRIEDNGRSFNPLEDSEEPDVSLPVEQRPIGGLGIHLAKNLIQDLSYRRVQNRNCLTLTQPL